ncbi:MAG: N-acetylmuramoyl-L-alanine amidase [Actinobacteria bacterium]|nr:N-acetylmuramoyl-L-alanine amidase [Actinomycetota bacterium]
MAAVVVLATVLFMGPVAGRAQAHSSSFSDVSEVIPAHDAIEYLTRSQVIAGFGDGTFGPEKTLTRGQATKVLVLWQELPLAADGPAFSDVDAVYRSYVGTAAKEGWITGYPDGYFRAYTSLSRQQMAIIMVRAMGWETQAQSLSSGEIGEILGAFTDAIRVADVARPYVAMAVQKGLFGGTNGRFNPGDNITRAQFSLVVFRAELSIRSVVTQVRSASDYPDKTRLVLDLSQAPGKVTASVSTDGKLNIDYADGAMGGVFTQGVASPEIRSVTVRQQSYSPKAVRIVVDMARFKNFRVMSLAPSEDKGYRIVVDVFRRTDGPPGDGPPLIVVDPGHGGSDSGAVGVAGTLEKNVNLAIGLLLADDLRTAGVGIIMTRNDDSFPSLQDRADIANAAQASLFVAVHNNAVGTAGDPEAARGTETYYWGTSDQYSVQGQLLAQAIQRNLLEALNSVDRGSHTANFAVLRCTDMPAALAEVGFLTNAEEEAKLITTEYQRAAAQGIAEGILEYLNWSTTAYTTE